MGYVTFAALSNAQIAKHIRSLAQNTSNVVFTHHVKKRMVEREVTNMELLQCLRLGTIRREPEFNDEAGTIECRMERQVLRRELACIVALCDEDPNLIIVTVFDRTT